MQLTLFTDYALRTLIYLAAHPAEVVPTSVIAQSYGISKEHLAKAAKWLTREGYVASRRGPRGGLHLVRAPSSIVIGRIIRETEPDLNLLECFEEATNTCALRPACRLKMALERARRAFFAELDSVTLADVVENPNELVQLLRRRPAAKITRAREARASRRPSRARP